jgi:FkbM family methyltransferase
MMCVTSQIQRLKAYTDAYGYTVRAILECGVRDCLTSNILIEEFSPAKVYAFECLPENIEICKKNMTSSSVILVEMALSNKEGTLDFFVTEEGGSSSLLEHVGGNKKVIQVKTARFDSLDISVDTLWLDAQGAELDILEGCGSKLDQVQVIQAEVAFLKGYKEQPSYWDIKKFLKSKGFYLAGFTSDIWTYADAVFTRKKKYPAFLIELHHAVLKKIWKLIKSPKKIFQYLAFVKKIPTALRVIRKKGEYEDRV